MRRALDGRRGVSVGVAAVRCFSRETRRARVKRLVVDGHVVLLLRELVVLADELDFVLWGKVHARSARFVLRFYGLRSSKGIVVVLEGNHGQLIIWQSVD